MAVDSLLKARKGKKHALVIPVSLQAHIAAILRHSIEIAKRGVTVTFVGQEQEISLLKSLPELQGLDFNLVSYSGSKEPTPVDQPLIHTFLNTVQSLFQPIREKLLEDKRAGLLGPTCMIGDRFLPWVLDLAKELKLPYYQFNSCGAGFVRLYQSYPPRFADGTYTMTEAVPEDLLAGKIDGRAQRGGRPVPERLLAGKMFLGPFHDRAQVAGLPALEHREMMNTVFGMDHTLAMGEVMGEADGLLVNTFYELESAAVDAIRQSWIDDCLKKIPKLFLIGPISIATSVKVRSFVGDQDVEGTNYWRWLDGQAPKSVIYFCLGSIAQFTRQQTLDLALAVEATEQRFLWVLKKGTGEDLPPDFEARTRGKVLIVRGWVPQLQILKHSSIGGFVTHCGWSSITESVSCAVPMACWPMFQNDQFLNCRYLVDVLKIAVEVRPAQKVSSAGPKKNDEFREFRRAVRVLMSEEEGDAMRSRVQDFKKKMEAAIADGGARKKAVDDFVDCIPECQSTKRSC